MPIDGVVYCYYFLTLTRFSFNLFLKLNLGDFLFVAVLSGSNRTVTVKVLRDLFERSITFVQFT